MIFYLLNLKTADFSRFYFFNAYFKYWHGLCLYISQWNKEKIIMN